MDPDENIKAQVALARKLIDNLDRGDRLTESVADALELSELVLALHEWRVAGGFDPYERRSAV